MKDKTKKSKSHRGEVANQGRVAVIIAATLIGWLFGFGVAQVIDSEDEAAKETESSHSHNELGEHEDDSLEPHSANMIQAVSAGNAPEVTMQVLADPVSGYNIQLHTQNFEFTPENAGKEHADNTGHAHIYINGEKTGRIYGEWTHVQLEEGDHELRVTLNTNDHRDYSVGGEVVGDSLTVSVDGHTDHTHADLN